MVDLDLERLIAALEKDSRVVSYSSLFTSKQMKSSVLENLRRLQDILEDDHLGADQQLCT